MQVGDIIHGFKLLKEEQVPEMQSVGRRFVHEKSGAHLLHFQNDDDNKVFYIAFSTPPADDTGVPHIIEHSVLCGSRKYPLKEPFVELVKGSLNTFLNAMTYPDKTVYPVASRNDRDFQNLVDVYLDAVFYPKLLEDPFTLMQEGWHYEQADKDAPLTYSGVVFNEMKGALSDPEGWLGNRTMANLYPDNGYRFESGGDPKAIPQLTQEKFVEFHRRYYHPSNSLIYFYGDMDIEEKLKYLDEEYLSHFTAIERAGKIEPQASFDGMRRVYEKYPIGQEESEREKTYLKWSVMLPAQYTYEDMLAMNILSNALFRSEGAPITQALIDAKIGSDVDGGAEGDLLQPFFSVTVTGSEKDRADKFLTILTDKLTELTDGGISPSLLEANVAVSEFGLREADFGRTPKGLLYGLRALSAYFYGQDPVSFLRYEEPLKNIKAGIGKGYFEKLLKKYVLDNPHKLLLIMEPDKKLAAERDADEAERLAAVKEKMSAGQLKDLREKAAALKARQAAPDSPEALATIPLLNLSDIKKETTRLPLEEREEHGAKVLLSDVNTNGIAYMNMYFDALPVPKEKLYMAYFLSDIIGALGTKERGYAELDELLNLHTGGISTTLTATSKTDEPDSFWPRFCLQSKSFIEKIPQTFDILTEILTRTVFTDKKRLAELAAEEIADIETRFQSGALNIVANRINSTLTKTGRYNYEGMLPYYRFLKELAANFNARYEELAAELAALSETMFNRHNLIVSVTLPDKDYGAFQSRFSAFADALFDEKHTAANYDWTLGKECEGFMNAGQVQYVGKGANFIKSGFKYTGSLQVLTTILRYDYFWTKIRVQGGAYGAMSLFNSNGNMTFGSYRDPHLRETIAAFDGTADFLRKFNVSDREMTKFIFGTMSDVDAPKTPQMKGNAAAEAYLRGVDDALRQKWRDEILGTRQKDIRDLAEMIDVCMKENNLCVFGNEEKLKENGALFTRLTQVSM